MKSISLLLGLSLISMLGSAQAPASKEPTPITRQEALKLKDIHEVLGLPATDSILKGSISMVSRKDRTDIPFRPAKSLADPTFQDMISNARSGERLIFSGFIVQEGEKQIKVETKTYVFK